MSGRLVISRPRLIEREKVRERKKDFSTDWFASFWTRLSVCVVLTACTFTVNESKLSDVIGLCAYIEQIENKRTLSTFCGFGRIANN